MNTEANTAAVQGTFDKNELINLVFNQTADTVGASKADVAAIVDEAFDVIQKQLPLFGYAQFHGFGSFRMQKLPAESGVTPQGEPYEIGERLTVQFNPGFLFREDIQKITGTPAIR